MFFTPLCWLLYLLLILIFLRAVASWFPISPYSRVSNLLYLLHRITEPILTPARRVIPPIRVGNMAVDLSAMIVIFVIFLLIGLVC